MVEFGRLLLKVLLPSFLLSWGIKVFGPRLGIVPELAPALLLVLFPPVAIAVWLAAQERGLKP